MVRRLDPAILIVGAGLAMRRIRVCYIKHFDPFLPLHFHWRIVQIQEKRHPFISNCKVYVLIVPMVI